MEATLQVHVTAKIGKRVIPVATTRMIQTIIAFFLFPVILYFNKLQAQDGVQTCKVVFESLLGDYKGECKNDLAEGQGEAKGIHHRYIGAFKNGLPNGYGTYYYSDSVYYAGLFLDGIKEGKGEMHYLSGEKKDSVIKGYWSGNEYRGKKYKTYNFNAASRFDRWDVSPTAESGNMIIFEISTTSGSPKGLPSDLSGKPGYVMTLSELVSNDPLLRFISKADNPTISYSTYEVSRFPVILYGTLSNGETFQLDLYKSAKWKVKLFVNK